jgi:hypothetical protein
MQKKWKWAAGGGAAFLILSFVALRFAGDILEPWLDASSSTRDSSTTSTAPADATPVTLASSTDSSGMSIRQGPFVINGTSYSFDIQRDTGELKSKAAARRVVVTNASGKVVYDENLFLRSDSTSSESWIEFYPLVLEDASGRPRGFKFSYGWFPSAPGSGAAFSVVAPRGGDSLVVLTPTVIGYYGSAANLPAGTSPQSGRLLPGNRMTIQSSNGWVDALVNLRVDFDCVPQSANCVRIDMPDSIAGLARFPIEPPTRVESDTITSIDLYAAPHSTTIDRIAIPPGQQPEILGGASRMWFERTPGLFLSADDQWLEVRINGKRGWITGAQAFRAIGLRQVG